MISDPRNRGRPSAIDAYPETDLDGLIFKKMNESQSKSNSSISKKGFFSTVSLNEDFDSSKTGKEEEEFHTFIINDPKVEAGFTCKFPQNQSSQVTVEWLFNEYSKWRMLTVGDDISLIACLTTADRNINFDYLLTKPSVALSAFPLSLRLEPYYVEPIETLDFTAFRVLQIVGIGSYSKVAVVRRRDTGIIYAMKILNKAFFAKIKKESYLFKEELILKTSNHPHLAKLFYIFQSNQNIFFILDFYPGGDLFNLVSTKGGLSEEDCQFYVEEVIEALSYMHNQGIIYRDLKPENVMLDWEGHIKIVDFGLSKLESDIVKVSYSFIGSKGYLSPETLTGKGHNFLTDAYALGVLIYDLLHCAFPIKDLHGRRYPEDTVIEKHQNIVLGDSLSVEASDLILRLLSVDPKDRLLGETEIKSLLFHPWFKKYRLDGKSNSCQDPVHRPLLGQFNFDPSFNRGLEAFIRELNSDAFHSRTVKENWLEGFDFDFTAEPQRDGGGNPIYYQTPTKNRRSNSEEKIEDTAEFRGSMSPCFKNLPVFLNKTKVTREFVCSSNTASPQKEQAGQNKGFFSFFFD